VPPWRVARQLYFFYKNGLRSNRKFFLLTEPWNLWTVGPNALIVRAMSNYCVIVCSEFIIISPLIRNVSFRVYVSTGNVLTSSLIVRISRKTVYHEVSQYWNVMGVHLIVLSAVCNVWPVSLLNDKHRQKQVFNKESIFLFELFVGKDTWSLVSGRKTLARYSPLCTRQPVALTIYCRLCCIASRLRVMIAAYCK
jgi:hypothetical protein